VGPTTAVALVVCYQADALASVEFAGAEGVDQGRTVAVVLVLAMVAAGLARAIGLSFDERLPDLRVPTRLRRPALATAAATALAALVIGVVVVDAPAELSRQVDRFMEGNVATDPEDARARLTEVGNNRRDNWDVAIDGWAERRVAGHGAGTFALLWAQERPDEGKVEDAHSIYLEALAELGVVGLLLLLIGVCTLLIGVARRVGGPNRALHGGILAVLSAWALHAGIDWDWELPTITIIPLALGGAALAARRPRISAPGRLTRIVIALGLLILALTPISIARSQSRLDAAADALRARNCTESIDRALASIDALSVRPEPFELLAYCNTRLGEPQLAEQMAREAIRRDPDNWQFHYVLAAVQAAGGQPPRR
jgi:O-antigen ligase